MRETLAMALAFAALAYASGKDTPTPANVAEIAVSSDPTPPGGTVQIKFSLTEPRPISSGGGYLDVGNIFGINGVALSGVAPDAMGLGILKDGKLRFAATSPTGSLGLDTDYPFLTLTMGVATSATPRILPVAAGFNLTGVSGPLTTVVKPGQIVIGGVASIRDVVPGGGTWPAGTVVRIKGMGFSPATQLRTTVKTTSIQYVSPEEIAITLKQQTTLDGKSFQITNPDRSSCSYYAYLRGTYLRPPARTLLNLVEPAFAAEPHAIAEVGPLSTATPGQFTALALQNPNPGPVSVSFELRMADGQRANVDLVLPSGARLMDDVSGLMNGIAVHDGDILRITSTASIQTLGISGDDATGDAAPFVPRFY